MTVIDTMIGGSAGRIAAGAEAIGAPIKRILLTHAHGITSARSTPSRNWCPRRR